MLDRGQDIEINLINMWDSRLLCEEEVMGGVGIGERRVEFWYLDEDKGLNI